MPSGRNWSRESCLKHDEPAGPDRGRAPVDPRSGPERYANARSHQKSGEHGILLGKVVAMAGQVEQVNRSAGEWGLLTDHGVKTGKVAPGGADLDGLQVGKRYRFKCAEVTELDTFWHDRKTLYLQSIEAA